MNEMEILSDPVNVTSIITFFSTPLWIMIQEMSAICIVVSVLSISITQAIKKSDEKVFTQLNASNMFMWFTNLFFVILLSVSSVLIFDGKNGLTATILYMIMITLFSWAMSILLYPCINYLFELIEIGKLKFDTWKINSSIIRDKTIKLHNEVKKELILSKVKNEVNYH